MTKIDLVELVLSHQNFSALLYNKYFFPIVVNNDTDAVCSAKILLSMFKCDNVSYTLIPVTGQFNTRDNYIN